MFKRILFSLGIFVLVLGTGAGIAKAARPDRPVYPTVQEVEQMIADASALINAAINSLGARLTLVETAVTGHNSDITSLNNRISTIENNLPSEPPFDLDLQIIGTGIPGGPDSPTFNMLRVHAYTTSTAQSDPFGDQYTNRILEAQIWGVAHTPEGDVYAKIIPYENGDTNLYFRMPTPYVKGTAISGDIYSFYAGKTVHKSVDINTSTLY